MESPCNGKCVLEKGVCEGCGRTEEEVLDWSWLPDSKKKIILKRLENEVSNFNKPAIGHRVCKCQEG